VSCGRRRAPLSGQLRAGFDADVIVLSENPLSQAPGAAGVGLLADPRNVKLVWKGGELEKGDAAAFLKGGAVGGGAGAAAAAAAAGGGLAQQPAAKLSGKAHARWDQA
jgi:hypothetical protein